MATINLLPPGSATPVPATPTQLTDFKTNLALHLVDNVPDATKPVSAAQAAAVAASTATAAADATAKANAAQAAAIASAAADATAKANARPC